MTNVNEDLVSKEKLQQVLQKIEARIQDFKLAIKSEEDRREDVAKSIYLHELYESGQLPKKPMFDHSALIRSRDSIDENIGILEKAIYGQSEEREKVLKLLGPVGS